MIPGFNVTLILTLNLAGTFAFGISGGLAGVRAHLDLFGVLVLAFVVALAGGTIRDLMIGTAPTTFRDWRYLAAAGSAGAVCFVARIALERWSRTLIVADAVGLGIFCVTGAAAAITHGLGPIQSILLGTITGVGGGAVRDVLLKEVPNILRKDLYAIPALLGATVLVVGHELGSHDTVWPLLGALLCTTTRLIGVHYNLNLPVAFKQRDQQQQPD